MRQILYSGYFSGGGGISVDMEIFAVSWKNFVVTCTRALMGVARCIYGNCFMGKYFVVCFSTTKILPSPPEKYPLYGRKTDGQIDRWTDKTEADDRSTESRN